jgi:phage terminase large subunit GpA-like protein
LGGSPASLAGDQAADVYIDEFDKMTSGVKGDADVFSLAKARADTYADRKIAVTSTPLRGLVETYRDDASGLEFWALAEPSDIESPIWAKWQSGTRHHWAWKCPHCECWFIPRIRDLKYPEGAEPAMARRNTWLLCPANGCIIEEKSKAAMNAAGQFIAPGQAFNGDVIEGEPPDSSNLSLWVSGLASPFLSWGERIEELLAADAMGDAESRQGAQNKAGELWSPVAGETLDWQTIANRREPYETNTIPEGVVYLTLGCDVQGDRLVYVIRGWGARSTSWLIEQGELLGDTSQTPVWGDLAEKLITPIDGCIIKLAFIDSGFRPGKKFAVPLNRIYQFCRRFKRFAFPTKGSSSAMTKPLVKVRPDVTKQGEVNKYGLELIRLDSDHWKSFIS